MPFVGIYEIVQKAAGCSTLLIRSNFAKATDADVINIALARTTDIDDLWEDLEIQMDSSVERPALSYRRSGSLITENCGELVSESILDSEGGVPSVSLFDVQRPSWENHYYEC